MARTGATGAARAPAEEPSRRSMTKVASMGAKKFGDARKRVTYRVKGGVVHIDGAIRAGARIVATSAKRSLGRATWTRPKLVVDWHRRDVHINPPTWWELFFDLLLVAACLKLGNYVKSNITFVGFGRFFTMAGMFWRVWLEQCIYNSRYHAHDTAHRVIAFFSSLGVIGMAVSVTEEAYLPDHIDLFVSSFVLCNVVTVFSVAEVWKASIRSRTMIKFQIQSQIGATLVAVGAFFVPYEWKFVVLVVCQLVGALFSRKLRSLPESQRVPVHVEHFSERHGELTMLALGEAVISLALPLVEDGLGHPFFVLFGTLLIVLLQTLYMEAQPSEVDHHALRQNMKSSGQYVWGHFVLFLGLILVGVGLKILLLHLNAVLHTPESWLLCGATSACLQSIYVIQNAHLAGFKNTLGGKTREGAHQGGWQIARACIGMLPCLIPIGVHAHALSPTAVLLLLTLICCIAAVLENLSRDEIEEHVEWAEDDRFMDDAIVAAIVETAAKAGGRGLTADEVEVLKAQYKATLGVGDGDVDGEVDHNFLLEAGSDSDNGEVATSDADGGADDTAEVDATSAREAQNVGSEAGGDDGAVEIDTGDVAVAVADVDTALAAEEAVEAQAVAAYEAETEPPLCPVVEQKPSARDGSIADENEEIRRLKMQVRCLRRTLQTVLDDAGGAVVARGRTSSTYAD